MAIGAQIANSSFSYIDTRRNSRAFKTFLSFRYVLRPSIELYDVDEGFIPSCPDHQGNELMCFTTEKSKQRIRI